MSDKGPIRILCDEIGFSFDRRIEREEVLLAFVEQLVDEIADKHYLAGRIADLTGKPPSDAAGHGIGLARSMVSRDLGLSVEARKKAAEAIHDLSHEVNPDDPGHNCDHLVDMLASCASAIRFGMETPCRSRHAADAAQHVWRQTYGVSRFDSHTPAWEKEWVRHKLQQAIISLLPPLHPKERDHD